VQKLVDKGTTIVGTLKLGSLITREKPTESADYHAAFNPRGDDYQFAWSSSGGSAAAIAAYDWLDFTIATDGMILQHAVTYLQADNELQQLEVVAFLPWQMGSTIFDLPKILYLPMG
jgi:hypothetical protein